jgi:5'-methylthioadenosine phosphorylase
MGRLALVLGSNATGPGSERLLAAVADHGAEVLQRHAAEDPAAYVPPHLIDHEANLRSLLAAGCDRVLAVCSVGSLKEEIAVGSLVCPDDFIALQLGITTFDDARGHMPPGFDREWRRRVLAASRARGAPLEDGGVYWQTIGPRFETPAEIRLLAAHADLVGMTMASECVVAGELGISYAAVCVVDNLANGVGAVTLDVEELEGDRARNAARLAAALEALLPELAS